MNKEIKKFKKVIKARKRNERKKRILEKEKLSNRSLLGMAKAVFLKEKKELSKKTIEERQLRSTHLRKVLDIAPNKVITLDALEKQYIEIEKIVKATKNK